MAQKIFITGVAGFIGYHLASAFLERGCQVTGVDNLNDYYPVELKRERLARLTGHPAFAFEKLDLAEAGRIAAAIEAARPEVVVHLAAQAGVRYSLENPGVYVQSNVVGFLNVLEACREEGIEHLVYASSSSVYGANQKVPFSTDDRTDRPVSLYAATKKSNELMAHAYSHLFGIATTGLRFFTVYGPWGRPDMAYYLFTKAIIEGRPIDVFSRGEMERDFTYIDDVVRALMTIVERGPVASSPDVRSRLYNIGNHTPVKLLDFVGMLERHLGREAIIRFKDDQPGDVPRTFADVAALQRDYGFSPSTPLEQGLAEFVDWYRKHQSVA